MQLRKKSTCLVLNLLLFSGTIFCFEPVSTCDLLMSFLENSNELKKNTIEVQKAQLSLDSAKISNGFDIVLSTGNCTLKLDDNGNSLSVKPSVRASIPQTSNLSFSASSNISTKKNETKFDDVKLNASVDLIGTTGLSRKIVLLKAQRNLIEAKRKLQNQAIDSEKTFYTQIKTLLTSTSSIINSQKTLYTSKIDLEKIKAQGYSSGSSTYLLAQMKVLSTEHEIENLKRALLHDYIVFYKECGYDIDLDDTMDFYELIPKDIVEIEPIDIHSFDSDLYTEIESALWTNKINSLQRKTKSNFSLGLNGGMTFNNTNTNSTTVDAGVSSKIGGIDANAGVNIPLDKKNNPALTFSVAISPNEWRLNSIVKKTENLDEQQELIAIENARKNFASKVVDYEKKLEDLQWTKKSDQETYGLYADLETNLAKWYNDGYVTESEYYSAKVNVQSYNVKKIINTIDFIIYNDNVVTMFVSKEQEMKND